MSASEEVGGDEALSFDVLPLPEPIRNALKDLNYTSPTPVQRAAFGPALKGKDLVVQARTGTGKTCAFGLPLVSGRVNESDASAQALVLTPTRELALQVKRELEALAQHTHITVVSVYGGAPMGKQIDELAAGAQIIVGTPGRVLDHLQRKTLDPGKLKAFVLDECDEMLSMGFLPQITEIWNQLPTGMQTLLFSATVPRQVERIAETRLKQPEFITLSGDHIGALSIQHFVYLSHGDKARELLQILEIENPESGIIFCNTRDETKRACRVLQDAGYDADWLNSDLNQNEREQVMLATREGRLRFLVCTDVAARGIDISHLTHVINYDFPENSEAYVHRTGRTGRAGRMGTAISLLEPSSIGDLYYLRLKYKIEPVERHLPTRAELKTRKEADIVAMLALRFPVLPHGAHYASLARRLMTHDDADSLIGGLLAAHLGEADAAEAAASAARRSAAPRPVVKEKKARRGPSERRERGRDQERAARPPARSAEAPEETTFEEEGFAYSVSDAPAPVVQKAPAQKGRARRRPSDSPSADDPTSSSARSESVAEAASDSGAPARSGSPEKATEARATLYLNVGRKDGARTSEVRDALVEAGVAEQAILSVHVKQRHTFVDVPEANFNHALEVLAGVAVCGRELAPERAKPRSEPQNPALAAEA